MAMQKVWLIGLLLLLGLGAVAGSRSAPLGSSTPPPISSGATLLAVGDISTCDSLGAFITAGIVQAQLLEQPSAKLALLGDIAYERGTDEEFKCFDTAWGKFKSISYPVPGNHEYFSDNAAGYYKYFGTRAGDPKRGYYTYTLGNWRMYALNSNCQAIGGCDTSSPQAKWLQKTLLENPRACTLAYWHHPRFSSGHHGNNDFMQDIWAILAKSGTELVLAGHDHMYERFKPLDKAGKPNPKGIRSFVIGTGGRSFYEFKNLNPNSAAKQNTELGIVKFQLEPNGYSWAFISAKKNGFTDTGRANCQ